MAENFSIYVYEESGSVFTIWNCLLFNIFWTDLSKSAFFSSTANIRTRYARIWMKKYSKIEKKKTKQETINVVVIVVWYFQVVCSVYEHTLWVRTASCHRQRIHTFLIYFTTTGDGFFCFGSRFFCCFFVSDVCTQVAHLLSHPIFLCERKKRKNPLQFLFYFICSRYICMSNGNVFGPMYVAMYCAFKFTYFLLLFYCRLRFSCFT